MRDATKQIVNIDSIWDEQIEQIGGCTFIYYESTADEFSFIFEFDDHDSIVYYLNNGTSPKLTLELTKVYDSESVTAEALDESVAEKIYNLSLEEDSPIEKIIECIRKKVNI